MLVVTITAPTVEQALHETKTLHPTVAIIEWRLDCLADFSLPDIISALPHFTRPMILTLRSAKQGGKMIVAEPQRLAWLEQLVLTKPAYLDCEADVSPAFFQKLKRLSPSTQLIASYHDFQSTPVDLAKLLTSMQTCQADIYKLITFANCTLDSLRMLRMVQQFSPKLPLVGHCMGEFGIPSRILGKMLGNHFTYAAINHEHPAAPGQISLQEMIETYRFNKLNVDTKVYALLGDPVSSSKGHLLHNAVYTQLDIPAVYVKLCIKTAELAEFFELITNLPFRGFSITMPHKQSVLPFLSSMTARAKKIGAVNTIKITPEGLMGDNTDGLGALQAITTTLNLSGKKAIILGAGGSAKAIALSAHEAGAKLTILNRTLYTAEQLAAECNGQAGTWEDIARIIAQPYDLIINTLPITAFTPALLSQLQALFQCKPLTMDILYNPPISALRQLAIHAGCTTISGLAMFINQALAQLSYWFDYPESQFSLLQPELMKKLSMNQ